MVLRRFRLPVILFLTLILLALAGGYLFAKAQPKQSNPPKSPIAFNLFKSSEENIPPPENIKSAAGDSIIDLSWDKPASPDVNGFLVYRWTTGGTPVIVARLPADTTGWSDTSVTNGLTYFYLVVSIDDNLAKSDVDAQAIATPAPPPPPPPEPEPVYYEYEEPVYIPPPVQQEPAPLPCPPAPGGG